MEVKERERSTYGKGSGNQGPIWPTPHKYLIPRRQINILVFEVGTLQYSQPYENYKNNCLKKAVGFIIEIFEYKDHKYKDHIEHLSENKQ